MKKLFALLLCCAVLAGLLTGCIEDVPAPDAPAEASVAVVTPADVATEPAAQTDATEEHDHVHINYKGLVSADYTLDDVAAAEGREPDFSFDVGDQTFYAYNNVTLNDLTFTQVQFSFSETGNRISCTVSGDEDTAAVMDRIRQSMTAQFGEPSASETAYTWRDGHTANYAMLTVLNETTVQLAFYISERT